MLTLCFVFPSCTSNNVKSPVYHSEITMDDNYNVTDWGRSGQLTEDGDYYYNGRVTLYDKNGDSKTFKCYIGNNGGLDQGCRGVIYNGKFYNLDRNDWITINGVKYKASDLVD